MADDTTTQTDPVTPAPPPPPATPPGSSTGGTPNGEDSNPAWLPDRLRRAEDAARKKLLTELGIENLDADKELLKSARAKADADKTELQKKADALAKAEADRDDFKVKWETEVRARRIDGRDSAIKAALQTAQVKNADKTYAVLLSLKKAEVEAVMGEDGALDAKKITALVELAKKDYAEDFGVARSALGSPSNNGGRARQQPPTPPDRPFGSL